MPGNIVNRARMGQKEMTPEEHARVQLLFDVEHGKYVSHDTMEWLPDGSLRVTGLVIKKHETESFGKVGGPGSWGSKSVWRVDRHIGDVVLEGHAIGRIWYEAKRRCVMLPGEPPGEYCDGCGRYKKEGQQIPYRGCSRHEATGTYFRCQGCIDENARINRVNAKKSAKRRRRPWGRFQIPFWRVCMSKYPGPCGDIVKCEACRFNHKRRKREERAKNRPYEKSVRYLHLLNRLEIRGEKKRAEFVRSVWSWVWPNLSLEEQRKIRRLDKKLKKERKCLSV